MRQTTANRLLAALRDPACTATWSARDWGDLVCLARSANLLACVGARLDRASPPVSVPPAARIHFDTARRVVEQRNAAALWEAGQLRNTLARAGIEAILLKGAAYVAAGLPLARHRSFSDIDLLVPRSDLPEAEKRLMLAGWVPTDSDPYDQRYYRQWMHEVPPLRHVARGTTLDLHHAIAPLTSRYPVNMAPLFAARLPAARAAGINVLSPPDMVIHAAIHLFAEGEGDNALRNLIDVGELWRAFRAELAESSGAQAGLAEFDRELIARAGEVGGCRALYLAFRYLARTFDDEAARSVAAALPAARPPVLALLGLDAVYDRVFAPGASFAPTAAESVARTALYLRGHWLRMPLLLLIPHLLRKVLRGTPPPPDEARESDMRSANKPARPQWLRRLLGMG